MRHYHESELGAHRGRDETERALERDWWWMGLWHDVRKYIKACVHCQGENAHTGMSAWTRTNLYSRPFRVLQFDLLAVPKGSITGSLTLLTVIDCFFEVAVGNSIARWHRKINRSCVIE